MQEEHHDKDRDILGFFGVPWMPFKGRGVL